VTNAELVAELLKWPPYKEVKFIEEHIVEWNEDNTPRISAYYEAYPDKVFLSNNHLIIKGKIKI